MSRRQLVRGDDEVALGRRKGLTIPSFSHRRSRFHVKYSQFQVIPATTDELDDRGESSVTLGTRTKYYMPVHS